VYSTAPKAMLADRTKISVRNLILPLLLGSMEGKKVT